MSWLLVLKAIGAGIRKVPWQLWAFLALALAFWWYGEHRHSQGRAEVQSEWDEAVERGRQEIARLDAENAAKDEAARVAAQHIGESRARDQRENENGKDRLIADLRAGNRQLRQQFQACLPDSKAATAPAVPGGPVRADPVRPADAVDLAGAVGESVLIADDADSRHARLIEYVRVLQSQSGCKR